MRLGLRRTAQHPRRARRAARDALQAPTIAVSSFLVRHGSCASEGIARAARSSAGTIMANRSNSSLVIALRAQQHRAAPTESERVLWSHIKACQLGVWFRRQVPIGNLIVDFLAPSVGLVVEVDGNCHRTRRHADTRRDVKLARMGYRVLRLESNLVLCRTEAAMDRLRVALGQG